MKPTGDKIFDYNIKVFAAIFGTAPDLSELDKELARDKAIEACEQARRDRAERRSEPDFERDSGARP